MQNKDRAAFFLKRIMTASGVMLRRLETASEISKQSLTDVRIAYGQIQTAFVDVQLDTNRRQTENADAFAPESNPFKGD